MRCLRCGYCCVSHWVLVVDAPDIGFKLSNIIEKKTGERCKHLLGDNPGEFSCGWQ